MTRSYYQETTVTLDHPPTPAEIEDAQDAFCDEWESSYAFVNGNTLRLDGEGTLSGGENEEQAHDRITNALQDALGKCAVTTRWVCLDEIDYDLLPSTTFGTDVTGLPARRKRSERKKSDRASVGSADEASARSTGEESPVGGAI
ncbi:MAG: hypothetical protein IT379_30285 [Deltaproteobacteria bacterium]|nr:hypothetical protein [Deltaproteobacteria bacterium]